MTYNGPWIIKNPVLQLYPLAMAASKEGSFRKAVRKSDIVPISGTRASLSNNQLLVSTGVTTLDYALGGGVPVGSVLLIEEDSYGVYSKILLTSWISQGLASGHEVFLASADLKPDDIFKDLSTVSDQPSDPTNSAGGKQTESGNELKIAWRYKQLDKTEGNKDELYQQFGRYYDVSQTNKSSSTCCDRSKLITFDMCCCDSNSTPIEGTAVADCYLKLLKSIEGCVLQQQFKPDVINAEKNILRLALHGIGSVQWTDLADVRSTCQLLYALRTLMRSSLSVCVLTIPTYLFQKSAVNRLRHLVDAVIRLESFAGTRLESDPLYKDYSGLLHVVKVPVLNSLSGVNCNNEDLVFKLRRKRFVIEKLHLPPSLKTDSSTELACSSKTSSGGSLDF